MRNLVAAIAAIAIFLLTAALPASAQEQINLKLSNWLPEAHPMSKFLDEWAQGLNEKSDGRLVVETFHSGQLGPVTEHYDMVRRGTVDIAYILHGVNSDRFPLTGLIDIPFLVKSSVEGTKLINNTELREKYLDPEHRGVKVLFLLTNQPAQILTAEKPIETVGDLAGLRIRFPTGVAKAFLEEMGANSVGIPPSAIAENLQKNVIDGLMIDYGGAGIAYKLGGMVKSVTELDAYVSSFGVVINEDSYARLPDDLRAMLNESVIGIEERIGQGWDGLNAPGKEALEEAGANIIVPQGDALDGFREAAATVRELVLAERDAAGVPATEAYELMQSLAGSD
ncbi:MAG: TRAP transporter substrate-binding protein [Rhizobiaceae bacterium]|nr:TRAP transporter substrate-binding protein [Rhizobiaceae bacterium]MCV0404962.1 TRAP transporter substrate-binding protein [Rhizobiaceae bacterium]